MDKTKTYTTSIFSPVHILGIVSTLVLLSFVMLIGPVYGQENGIESLRKTGKAFAAVAKKVSPSVVFIRVEKAVETPQPLELFPPFGPFGNPFQTPQAPEEEQRVVSQGSGFIVSSDGYILTNNHVVGDADRVLVTLHDRREFEAEIIGTDPRSDVAVIKIDAKDLPTLTLGDSDLLEVGEWVIAVGNPFGLSHTLTAGIVSAKGRSSIGITDYENFIQTDAAINPGNSGGPLVNLDGESVGMNTAIFSQSGGYMGIGFAIPSSMIKVIQDQLIKYGSVTRGFLGIVIQDLTSDLKKSFGLENQEGVLISQVAGDSPAEKAGLKQGDVIIEFAGKPVENVGTFRNRVALIMPGTSEKITILRDGKRKMITLTMGKLPERGLTASVESDSLKKLGLRIQNLSLDLAERLGYQGETGVVVTEVISGSPAAFASIKAGVLIQEVNHKRIRSMEEFEQAIEKISEHNVALMLIKEGQFSRYVTLKMVN